MKRFLATSLGFFAALVSAHAILFDSTGDPAFNTSAPTGALAGSGWQYEGLWGSFLGTPIAPQFFITAGHVGGLVSDAFRFGGADYVTTAFFDDPDSDLRIWQIAGAFPTYAPLYFKADEAGKNLVVIGRGTRRGTEVLVGDTLKGWQWGVGDGVERWGENKVADIADGGAGLGLFLAATFDHNAGPNEAHLSAGDSGGAVFIQDTADGQWKLAGINYAVDGPYSLSVTGSNSFNATLFDQSGFYRQSENDAWTPASGAGAFYATRISSDQAWINSVIPEPSANTLLLAGAAMSLAGISCRKRGRSENRTGLFAGKAKQE